MSEASAVAANAGPRIRGVWPGGGFVALHLFGIASVVVPEVVRRNLQGDHAADGAALLAGLLAFLVVLTSVVILQRNESARRSMRVPYSDLFVARDAIVLAYSLQMTPLANFAAPQLEEAGTKAAVLGILGLFFISFVWGRLLLGRSIYWGAITVLGALCGLWYYFRALLVLSFSFEVLQARGLYGYMPALLKFAEVLMLPAIMATLAAVGVTGVAKILDDETKARGLGKVTLGLMGAAFLLFAFGQLAVGMGLFPEEIQRPADLHGFIGAGGVWSALFFLVAAVGMVRTLSRPTASAVVGGVFALVAALGLGVALGAKSRHAALDETGRAHRARRDSDERRAVAEHAEEDTRRRIAEADANRQRQAAAALLASQNAAALAAATAVAAPTAPSDVEPVTTKPERHSPSGGSHHRSRRGGGGGGSSEPDLGDLGL